MKMSDKRVARLKRIEYADLNAKQKENYNFHEVAVLLAYLGFNCIRLSDDWQGADFLAYHVDGEQTLKVQLKSRPMIARKYVGKRLHIAFPLAECWYMVEHDVLVRLVGKTTNWLETRSWRVKGAYSAAQPNPALLKALKRFALGAVTIQSGRRAVRSGGRK